MRTFTLMLASTAVVLTMGLNTGFARDLSPAADRLTAAVNKVTH